MRHPIIINEYDYLILMSHGGTEVFEEGKKYGNERIRSERICEGTHGVRPGTPVSIRDSIPDRKNQRLGKFKSL